MTVLILGGGLAGVSLANFVNEPSIIIEKEEQLGGLCRSFNLNGIWHDIGPHILFSKNKELLSEMLTMLDTQTIKRSNKILHKGILVKYPFENDLGSLPAADRDYCLNEFLKNPYESYEEKNLLHFFLKTFGEGITRLYLQPYNEKIWKYDPAFLDVQMIGRIPKPPKEDIIKSAKGTPTEGYLHQLYFQYPKSGGIKELINAYVSLIKKKVQIICSAHIQQIEHKKNAWIVQTDKGVFRGETLVNCMPLHELIRYIDVPEDVQKAIAGLRYISICTVIVQAKKDALGNNYAINIADKNILFHRISKINFLGPNYSLLNAGSTIMAEITYRENSNLSKMSAKDIKERVISDLNSLGFVKRQDVMDSEVRKFKYAYVLYELNHRKNTDKVLAHISNLGILYTGRFAEFEYLNMDDVVSHSKKLAEKLNMRHDEKNTDFCSNA